MTKLYRFLEKSIKEVLSEHGEGDIADHGGVNLDLDLILEKSLVSDPEDLTEALHDLLDHSEIDSDDADAFVTALLGHAQEGELDFLKKDEILEEYFV